MSDLPEFDHGPDGEIDGWRLSVSGAVERPRDFSAADVRALPLETVDDDFECVEGWVAEGLSWRGVRVSELLALAGPVDGSQYALVSATDGDFACSFPLTRLADALLAVELDGDPLPPEHGGPARLVPTHDGRDCWESIKWVSSIDVRKTEPTAGDTAKDRALSRIE